MRCHCCDKLLTDAEIQYEPKSMKFDMCSICLEIALDTAYSDGFQRPDDTDGVELLIDDLLDDDHFLFNLSGQRFQPEGYVD